MQQYYIQGRLSVKITDNGLITFVLLTCVTKHFGGTNLARLWAGVPREEIGQDLSFPLT